MYYDKSVFSEADLASFDHGDVGAEILYKDLKNHNFKSRKEVNQYLREMEKWTYNGFVKQEAKLRYYKETGI